MGYLTKKGAVVKNWKRRYFVAKADYSVDYYESEEVSIFQNKEFKNKSLACLLKSVLILILEGHGLWWKSSIGASVTAYFICSKVHVEVCLLLKVVQIIFVILVYRHMRKVSNLKAPSFPVDMRLMLMLMKRWLRGSRILQKWWVRWFYSSLKTWINQWLC